MIKSNGSDRPSMNTNDHVNYTMINTCILMPCVHISKNYMSNIIYVITEHTIQKKIN